MKLHAFRCLIAYSDSTADYCEMAMAAPEGWTIINQAEENNNSFVSDPSGDAMPSLNDYFEVTGNLDRRCNLCSRELRLNAKKDSWALKRHFKSQHQTEWAKLKPFMSTRPGRPNVRLSFG